MSTEVVMPQMGESIAEGTITKWLKKLGERVERDEPLFEISTDKVDAEIPSPAAGTLTEVRYKEGDTVEVNTVVAVLDGDQASATAAAPAEGGSACARSATSACSTATSATTSCAATTRSGASATRSTSAGDTNVTGASATSTGREKRRQRCNCGGVATDQVEPTRTQDRAGARRRYFATRRHWSKWSCNQERHPELHRIGKHGRTT